MLQSYESGPAVGKAHPSASKQGCLTTGLRIPRSSGSPDASDERAHSPTVGQLGVRRMSPPPGGSLVERPSRSRGRPMRDLPPYVEAHEHLHVSAWVLGVDVEGVVLVWRGERVHLT